MLENIILLIIYATLIVLIAKYMLYYCVRNIASILKLKTNTTGQILGYLTSMPELISAIFIAYHGMLLTVAYNMLSSNIINVILAVIITGAFGRFSYVKWGKFKIEYTMIIISILLPLLIIKLNIISNVFIVPIYLLLYVVYTIITRKLGFEPQEEMFEEVEKQHYKNKKERNLKLIIFSIIIFIGIIFLYLLGNKLGNIVFELASVYEIPQILLGIAIGFITSLPEMTTFIEAYANNKGNNIKRGSKELINNILASNVSNVLIIQAIAIIIFVLFNI